MWYVFGLEYKMEDLKPENSNQIQCNAWKKIHISNYRDKNYDTHTDNYNKFNLITAILFSVYVYHICTYIVVVAIMVFAIRISETTCIRSLLKYNTVNVIMKYVYYTIHHTYNKLNSKLLNFLLFRFQF